jgi:spore coat protein CotH
MRHWLMLVVFVLLSAGAVWLCTAHAADVLPAADIRINEFLADNDSVIADEWGEYDDVLELYNLGEVDLDLRGMYLTDDLDDPEEWWQITGTLPITLAAGGFVVFWADSSPDQGPNHTGFSLSKGGEEIGLFDTDANGNSPIDTYAFGAQATDVSEGRCPDGGPSWHFSATPTIGSTNEPCGLPPDISGTLRTPEFPAAGEPVTVTSVITDDGLIIAATLWYSAGVEWVTEPMLAQAGVYSATIPGQPPNTPVLYYVEARDDSGWTSTDPAGAPQHSYAYVAGFVHLPVVLNEVMADNSSTLEDPDEPGEFPDWIELHNYGPDDLDLEGFFLTDTDAEPTQFPITSGLTIRAGGYLLFYADGDTEQGPLHTNFKLSSGGETVAMYGAQGLVRQDGVQFPSLDPDDAYGRQPDGTGAWSVLVCASPGAANHCAGKIHLPFVLRGIGSGAAPIPLRINCGSDEPYTAMDGTTYLADRSWTEAAGYGAIGGVPDLPVDWWEGNPVGGTEEDPLYKVQRAGWQEYRASRIPNGSYLLTLRFQEQVVHGPGLALFDLVAEGQTLLDDLDVYAQAGRYYAMDARFAITVSDGSFNLAAIPSAGVTSLAAWELVPRQADSTSPGAPSGLSATPSYNAVLLDWFSGSEDDLAGYHVYRADQPEGPYSRVNGGLVRLSKYQHGSQPGAQGFYRVSAVDVYGNESALTPYVVAAALDASQATLPLYQLEVSPENLAFLQSDPFRDDRVPATFSWQDLTLDTEVRFRGGLSRSFGKKSWKIVFDAAESPFPNHDRINVNANWLDGSLIRARLANDLFDEAGIEPPGAEAVLLMLNGEYMGVYTRNEQVDEGFLASSGRSPTASIYKVVGRFAEVLPDLPTYQYWYEKETNEGLPYDDLIALIELINNTPDDAFAAAISEVMDVGSFLDYLAVIVLTSNFDSATHNIYLVHDLETGLWELVPWDLDATFSKSWAPIDMGTLEHPEAPGRANILRSRILKVPEFRVYYCQTLAYYLDSIFSVAAMNPKIDALYAQVEPDGRRDWQKASWEDPGPFVGSPSDLKDFVVERRAHLQSDMQAYCPTH